jgi:hypothetical protein
MTKPGIPVPETTESGNTESGNTESGNVEPGNPGLFPDSMHTYLLWILFQFRQCDLIKFINITSYLLARKLMIIEAI